MLTSTDDIMGGGYESGHPFSCFLGGVFFGGEKETSLFVFAHWLLLLVV
jgi:hypothetical protein